LYVIPEEMEDWNANETGDHHDAVNHVIQELFAGLVDEIEMDKKEDIFWDEWNPFTNRLGVFKNKSFCNSASILKGESHIWYD
jgi:hypothetical protein